MAHRKRTSVVLEAANRRLAGLSSITPAPDFGPSATIAAYTTQINNFNTLLNHYNQMISAVDEVQNQVDAGEASLREMNMRMLAAAAAQFGPDSNQYEQAGGKRLRDRKRPGRRALEKPPEKADGETDPHPA